MPVFFPTFFVSFLLAAAAGLEITEIAKTFQAFQVDLGSSQSNPEASYRLVSCCWSEGC
jgi:hypothetical protein